MRRLISFVILFLAITVPAHADSEENICLSIVLGPVQYFAINNMGPLTYTFDEYSDFGTPQDIGDVNYDLTSNTAWEVTCMVTDGNTDGQTSNDWDSINWTLSVNGVVVDEIGTAVIDSDGSPALRTGATWEVLLTIPWAESTSSADCKLVITASTV